LAQHAHPAAILASLLAIALALGGPLRAAPPESVRIGYVDMKRLLDNAPQVVASRRKLEREFAARDTALQDEEKRAAALRLRQAAATGAEAETLQRELDALERSIRRSRENLRTELKARSDQELDQSWRQINDAVVEFAREQGYDLIVPSPVIFASPRVDVTERILERLRRTAGKAQP